ncbi:TetR/AcrR family transcriptional regulator [Hoyosella altamirensis]|uniref:AcrR family transcriptional regulator n=1 Tax=Hoyosella altamirensis TaxID=616997 RepID=A0A839RHL6_9ACTN|nr:TetR/AcrR family transcriptional regulator [Hoyosella altamirensis]MBB3036252.1 AcrR family transcriptional regulator [Hoyosella altamirensis]
MAAPKTAVSDAKQERVRRRRRQVLQAATRLMQVSGFHSMSMQAVADEAKMSVGLIYQYFGNKEDVLRAVIVDILEDFRDEVPAALDAAGADPVKRLSNGFRVFCQVVDAKRAATVLTYRESKTLTPEGLEQIKHLELETTEPIRQAVRDGVEAGVFADVDAELVVHNLLMCAHGWALKHWHLSEYLTLEQYIERELAMLLASIRPAG